MICTSTCCHATFAVAEKMSTYTTSNYCGDLLGTLLIFLIIKAAELIVGTIQQPLIIACNNMGIVIHGNNLSWSLKKSQAQPDIIRAIHTNLASISCLVFEVHVYGHQDNERCWSTLTLPQQLNIIADRLSKDCLVRSVMTGLFVPSKIPSEHIWL